MNHSPAPPAPPPDHAYPSTGGFLSTCLKFLVVAPLYWSAEWLRRLYAKRAPHQAPQAPQASMSPTAARAPASSRRRADP